MIQKFDFYFAYKLYRTLTVMLSIQNKIQIFVEKVKVFIFFTKKIIKSVKFKYLRHFTHIAEQSHILVVFGHKTKFLFIIAERIIIMITIHSPFTMTPRGKFHTDKLKKQFLIMHKNNSY